MLGGCRWTEPSRRDGNIAYHYRDALGILLFLSDSCGEVIDALTRRCVLPTSLANKTADQRAQKATSDRTSASSVEPLSSSSNRAARSDGVLEYCAKSNCTRVAGRDAERVPDRCAWRFGNGCPRVANEDNPDISFLNALAALHAEAQEIIRCHLAYLNRVDSA